MLVDAFISREAYQALQALNLIFPGSSSEGLLIGHKRGGQFFVEKIFPSLAGFFPSLEKYNQLDQLFEGRLIGFFSFKPEEKKVKKILVPFACGKLFLKLIPKGEKKLNIQSFVIDYEKKFFLAPIQLKIA